MGTLLKATGFTDTKTLGAELEQLNELEPGAYAILAAFNAVAPNGQTYRLSCFIEKVDADFGITGVVESSPEQIDLANLKLDILGQQILRKI